MARLIIHGGKRLQGRIKVAGNKNAVLPMLAAAVLTDEPVVLADVPIIDDVLTMLAILEHLGVSVSLHGRRATLHARDIRRTTLPRELCSRLRSSILFAGPMCARVKRATIYPPGGDVIGRRRLDAHFLGLRQLGVSITTSPPYGFRVNTLRGADIILDEASVTATENIVMAATLAKGTTTLYNAACEPHVQDLCVMLNRMGARISGIGTNRLTIEGVHRLRGVQHRVSSDHIEAASFLAAAAVTGGQVILDNAPSQPLAVIAPFFRKLNLAWETDGNCVRLKPPYRLKVKNDLGGAIPKIEDGAWPAFPSDLMSVAIVLATQTLGPILFFEKMFESRMYFVDRLIEMGARIVPCDPHRVIVAGRSRLHGIHMSSPDIRAGMALVIAALCARGTSCIDNAQSIDRGYERIEYRLRSLGADIERLNRP